MRPGRQAHAGQWYVRVLNLPPRADHLKARRLVLRAARAQTQVVAVVHQKAAHRQGQLAGKDPKAEIVNLLENLLY